VCPRAKNQSLPQTPTVGLDWSLFHSPGPVPSNKTPPSHQKAPGIPSRAEQTHLSPGKSQQVVRLLWEML